MTDAAKKTVETQPKTQKEIDAEIEARKAEAVKAIAEAKKAEQEAAYFAAQTRRELATAEQEECELYVTKINRDIQEELRKRQLAADTYHHVYRFVGAVTDDAVSKCISELSYWSRSCHGCDITIIFYSPGGSVIPGMALYDFIRRLSNDGHHITTMCAGYICKRVVDIFVNRSGGKLTKSRMTREWVGHDWWIDSDLALTLGIVDEVR